MEIAIIIVLSVVVCVLFILNTVVIRELTDDSLDNLYAEIDDQIDIMKNNIYELRKTADSIESSIQKLSGTDITGLQSCAEWLENYVKEKTDEIRTDI